MAHFRYVRSHLQPSLFARALSLVALASVSFLVSACDNPAFGPSTSTPNYMPGVYLSYSNSTLTSSDAQITPGNSAVLTLTLRDTNNQVYSSASAVVSIAYSGGTSGGTLSPLLRNADGTYSATFTASQSGTAVSFSATVNSQPITSAAPQVSVYSGAVAGIAVVSGTGQSATVGTTLTQPFTALVTDFSGNPVSAAQINWVVSGGGGSLSSTTSYTDGTGQATSTLTLGTASGVNSVTATVAGTSDRHLYCSRHFKRGECGAIFSEYKSCDRLSGWNHSNCCHRHFPRCLFESRFRKNGEYRF
jgi:hypothetical protein